MLRVLLSSDALDMSTFFGAIEGNHADVDFEAFLLSNKCLIDVDKHDIPNRHRKQVSKILKSYDKHLLFKATNEIIDKLMTEGMHIYYLK